MNRALFIIPLLVISSKASSEGLCSFTSQENEFFEFSESNPFTDRDYSPEEVEKSKQRLADYEAGKKIPYYIHENIINIIKGGELQATMLTAKNEFDNYAPQTDKEWDRKEHELKLAFLSARKAYCDFRRTHYAIDW